MNASPGLRGLIRVLGAMVLLATAGCEFEVPLSTEPEQAVEPHLLGKWTTPDGWAKVVRYDDRNYVITYNGVSYRAWHARIGETDYLCLRNLEQEKPAYHYLTYAGDARRVEIRFVRGDGFRDEIHATAQMRQELARRAHDPLLLSDPVPFTRMN